MVMWARYTNSFCNTNNFLNSPSPTWHTNNFRQFPIAPAPSFMLLFQLFSLPKGIISSQPAQRKRAFVPPLHLRELTWLIFIPSLLRATCVIVSWQGWGVDSAYVLLPWLQQGILFLVLNLQLRSDKCHFCSKFIVQSKSHGYTQL